MTDREVCRRQLTVSGQVQGVGFRPFVYRLAAELGLTGFVANDSRGAAVEIQGPPDALRTFRRRLEGDGPPLCRIDRLDAEEVATVPGEVRFEIRPSRADELPDAQITVDTATCDDCLREMNTPTDPRYKYPFINCTNCGPRYTIVRRIPYDRPNTAMAEFAMCPMCAGQYGDPADRRFHAQPVACEKCGPRVWLVDSRGRKIARPACSRQAGSSRSRAWAAFTWPAVRTTTTPCAACAVASAAMPSRSR